MPSTDFDASCGNPQPAGLTAPHLPATRVGSSIMQLAARHGLPGHCILVFFVDVSGPYCISSSKNGRYAQGANSTFFPSLPSTGRAHGD
eukprot:750060-Pyramimonas_sp.AAC.1